MKIRVEIKSVFKNADAIVKATAMVFLNESFAIHNVRLIYKNDNLFVSLPSIRNAHGKWKNTCHPTKPEFRDELHSAYLAAYNEYLVKHGLE